MASPKIASAAVQALQQQMDVLGLNDYQNTSLTSKEYQRQMAAKLRQSVFLYLAGKLKDKHGNLVPLGPAAAEFRKNAEMIGRLDQFIQTQSRNQAWARDLELTLLAELLKVNFAVTYANTGSLTVLYANPHSDPAATITLSNTANVSWDAVINGRKDTATLHDGNCGYAAFARGLQAVVQPQPASQPKSAQFFNSAEQKAKKLTQALEDQFVHKAVQDYQTQQNTFNVAQAELKKTNPTAYATVQKQIQEDYQLALKVFLSDYSEEKNTSKLGM